MQEVSHATNRKSHVDLTGRTALITGGTRGLGRAMAERFAGSGANVIIVARRQNVIDEATDEINRLGKGRVTGLRCDVSRADDIACLAGELRARAADVDILVNNAGSTSRAEFESITDEMWYADLELKLFAAIRLMRVVIPAMKTKQWGRIINVVNVVAKAPEAGTAPTSVTRAAGIALTKVVSGELAPFGVTVNALCVGLIKTDQMKKRFEREGGARSFDQFVAETFASKVPMQRVGEAEEFASTACFLASDESAFITGCAINVDGGLCKVV